MKDEKAKAARRAYYKVWRKKNPEKVRAAQERYWMKKYEEDAAAESAGQ